MRTLAIPKAAEPWSLTSLREKLIKIGARVISYGRSVILQMAEVAVSRQMFADTLSLIAWLRAPLAPARAEDRAKCYRQRQQSCALVEANQRVSTPQYPQLPGSVACCARNARFTVA